MPDAPATDATNENDTGVKLEDMFNDDDENEEFPAPRAPDTKMESPPAEE
jgi:DNA primase small subunit